MSARKKNQDLPTVSVIIPAFNEEFTVTNVLQTVIASQLANEIIMVNDGSTDSTGKIAEQVGIKVIHLSQNKGKGNALSVGLKHASGDVVLFLDADLIGLNPDHINALLQPVINKEVKMTVGKFYSGAFWTTLSQQITPFLSGQRAIEKKALQGFQDFEKLGFGVETALTLYFKKNNLKYKEVLLNDLTHVIKEKKFGFLKGFLMRMKMYSQILRSLFRY
jgi:cellulose synthase/poly-beta-1,6-N-acetylglucosamine synthase-like glycosyltransferase